MKELHIIQILLAISFLVNCGLAVWIWTLKEQLHQRIQWGERIRAEFDRQVTAENRALKVVDYLFDDDMWKEHMGNIDRRDL